MCNNAIIFYQNSADNKNSTEGNVKKMDTQTVRLLHIDDSLEDLIWIERVFNKSSASSSKYYGAQTLSQGFELLKKNPIDVILLDLGLPDSDGTSTLMAIKKDYPDIAFIVVSGTDSKEMKKTAMRAGAQDYIAKRDIEPERLASAISYGIARKKAELSLVGEKDKAVKVSELKSLFLANMSHDIRTPMNIVLGTAEVLNETRLNQEQRQFVNTIMTSGRILLRLINDILDFSKIEANELSVDAKSFDLNRLTKSVMDVLKLKAQTKGLTLEIQISEETPTHFIGDPDRIAQILVNLIGNSLKFTDEGDVTLKIDSKKIQTDRYQLTFRVSDTGVGIPTEVLPHVFDTFIQDQNSDRKIGGSGLGLHISKRLVEAMNGTIHVVSEEGIGSTFTFAIPLQKSSTKPQTEEAELQRNLLIVDDEDAILEGFKQIIDSDKVTTYYAKNAQQALDIIRKIQIQTVICDFNLPGKNGFELEQMLAHHQNPIPFIFMSGTLDKKNISRRLATGSFSFYQKPFGNVDRIIEDAMQSIELFKNANFLEGSNFELIRHPMKILLADDVEANRNLIELFCKKYPIHFAFAKNGQECFEKFRTQDFDLVLLDMQMPVLDGYQAAQKMRAFEVTNLKNRTPIVALTASVLKTEVAKGLESGCDSYLTKPIKKRTLLTEIAKQINPTHQEVIKKCA